MEWISNKKILIVGLGLMGGSYAKKLKRIGFKVGAISRRQKTIDYAIEHGIIDKGYTEVNKEFVGQADAVIFGLYPEKFVEWIKEYGSCLKKGCMITDVTGVKAPIVYKIQELLPEGIEFIAAHPMCGKEVYGVENADDSMFNEANYIVTPTVNNSEAAIEWCKNLGRILGCRSIAVLSPKDHDMMIAFTSQLTHCIAVSLMNSNDDVNLSKYTGDSFRDLTRIARINEDMWSELFLMNKDALLNQMNIFEEKFDELKKSIENNETEKIKEIMRVSTERRSWFDK